MEKHFRQSIDATIPTIYSGADHPGFGDLYGIYLRPFLWSGFMLTPICSLLTRIFP